jgi:hypothetical protein
LVDAGAWAASGRDLLEHWAASWLARSGDGSPQPTDVQDRAQRARRWLDQGQALLLIDGLDEIAARSRSESLRDQLAQALEKYSSAGVVMTSRFGGYGDLLSDTACKVIEMMPLRREETRRYLEHNLGKERGRELDGQLQEDARMRNLVGNPFFLALVAFVHRQEQFRLPAGLAAVFDAAVAKLISLDPQRGNASAYENLGLASTDNPRSILNRIAARAFARGQRRFIRRDHLIEHTEAELPPADRRKVKSLLAWLCDQRIVNERGDGYQFVHLSVQEFLTGCHLAEVVRTRPDDRAWGLRRAEHAAWDREWDLVLQFAASQLSGRVLELFVERLLHPRHTPTGHDDDFFAWRALQASRCLSLAVPQPGRPEAERLAQARAGRGPDDRRSARPTNPRRVPTAGAHPGMAAVDVREPGPSHAGVGARGAAPERAGRPLFHNDEVAPAGRARRRCARFLGPGRSAEPLRLRCGLLLLVPLPTGRNRTVRRHCRRAPPRGSQRSGRHAGNERTAAPPRTLSHVRGHGADRRG